MKRGAACQQGRQHTGGEAGTDDPIHLETGGNGDGVAARQAAAVVEVGRERVQVHPHAGGLLADARHDLARNRLVSADIDGIGRGGARPMLSEDGGRLVFWSLSGQLVGGDANGLWDIFVFDSGTGTNTRVSLTSAGGERDQGTESTSRVVAPADPPSPVRAPPKVAAARS